MNGVMCTNQHRKHANWTLYLLTFTAHKQWTQIQPTEITWYPLVCTSAWPCLSVFHMVIVNGSEGHFWPIQNNEAVCVYSHVTSGRIFSFMYWAITWFVIMPFPLRLVGGKVVLRQPLLRVDSSAFLCQCHSASAPYLLISCVTDPNNLSSWQGRWKHTSNIKITNIIKLAKKMTVIRIH
jgi:hypothetical protein